LVTFNDIPDLRPGDRVRTVPKYDYDTERTLTVENAVSSETPDAFHDKVGAKLSGYGTEYWLIETDAGTQDGSRLDLHYPSVFPSGRIVADLKIIERSEPVEADLDE